MTFLILLTLLLISYQIYKLSKLAIVKDEQEKDFPPPTVDDIVSEITKKLDSEEPKNG